MPPGEMISLVVAPAPHQTPRQQLASALRRTADAHDDAARVMDEQDRPERAAWHRTAAKVDRARADRLENDPRVG
jgi:hypothetical protein